MSMCRRTIFILVIYFWSIPRMLLDPIYQSVKELVRNLFLLLLFYVLHAEVGGKRETSCVVTRPNLEYFPSGTKKSVLLIAALNKKDFETEDTYFGQRGSPWIICSGPTMG